MGVWNEVGAALASEFALPDAGTMTVIVVRVLCAAVLGGKTVIVVRVESSAGSARPRAGRRG